MKIKNWIPIIALLLIAIILTISGIWLPWWSVNMSPEAEMSVNGTARADYGLQFVTASRTVGNDTQVVSMPITNLTKSQENLNAITLAFNVMIALIAAGLTLSFVSLALIIISIKMRPMQRFASKTTTIAAFLIFMATVYMVGTLPTFASKLDSVMPVNIPSTWVAIKPMDITGFWGVTKIPSSAPFPTWAYGGNFWTWGPASGWLMTFTAFLLLFVAAVLIGRTKTEK